MGLSAAVSLVAAFVLSIDAWQLAANPDMQLSCDVNAVLSCGKVALSWQAKVLGFPNAFIGLAAEPVVVTIAVASLAGTRFPRWFMMAAQLVYLVGVVFAYWLFMQSLLEIGALCPWCLIITVSTTFVFMTLLHANALQENLYLPPRAAQRLKEFFLQDLDLFVVATALVLIAAAIVLQHGNALFG
ncbi:MAG: vitamin K epoxide reductase family protein [Actinomycetota bacterium]|nr:vitamin K epoxide reductase family protein [Actinomycetota bacterium]